MITTTCNNCNRDLIIMNYKLIQFDDKIVVREYFGRCVCDNIVTHEDYLEEDQIHLELPEPHRYFPRSR